MRTNGTLLTLFSLTREQWNALEGGEGRFHFFSLPLTCLVLILSPFYQTTKTLSTVEIYTKIWAYSFLVTLIFAITIMMSYTTAVEAEAVPFVLLQVIRYENVIAMTKCKTTLNPFQNFHNSRSMYVSHSHKSLISNYQLKSPVPEDTARQQHGWDQVKV